MLAIDCGNTRLKWGVFVGEHLTDSGALPLAELGALPESLPNPLPRTIAVSNVAGEAAATALRKALEGRGRRILWVRAQREQCGVGNTYSKFEQLGADRWAALIGARSLRRGPSLVVMAGTATTVDFLDAGGVFQGGLILPGLDLMRRALARNAAQLEELTGEFVEQPRNTADAIASGCLTAQLGAIERVLRAAPADTHCLLSGGSGQPLFDRLEGAKRLEPHLVLIGLRCIADNTARR